MNVPALRWKPLASLDQQSICGELSAEDAGQRCSRTRFQDERRLAAGSVRSDAGCGARVEIAVAALGVFCDAGLQTLRSRAGTTGD